jgi:linoleoyl-CoA desaturase
MATPKPITFAGSDRDFTTTLNKRVSAYFKERNISRHANPEMVVKTIIMFGLYFIPYVLIVTSSVTHFGWLIALVVVMSFGFAGIGLAVMHDANHGAYSGNATLNTIIGYSLNLIGASMFNWKMQHNVLHHTYTNIHDEDEDIGSRGVLRMSPSTKWKLMHRYQFIYAWFLYGFMTIVWVMTKDFNRLARYQKSGLMKKYNANATREWIILCGTKIFYLGYMMAIPLLFTNLLWWQILIGFFILHYLAGFIMAIIFQPAHVIEGTTFPLPDENRALQNNWTVHQLLTTTNYSGASRWFSWYVGGLNFQIEHHLFPSICHVHYRKIAGIVKETAIEFGLPYKSVKTFLGALVKHTRLLRQLGKQPLQ